MTQIKTNLKYFQNHQLIGQTFLVVNNKYDDVINEIKDILNIDNLDIIEVGRLKDKKLIGIEQIKVFKKQLLKSSHKKVRLGIILDSHLLSDAAANSLLKISEELPKKCTLVFLATEEKILPTIRSRLNQIITIPSLKSPKNEIIEEFLFHSNLSAKLKWIEESKNLDLEQTLKEMLWLLNDKKNYLPLKELILDSIKLAKASVNQKLILEKIALIAGQTVN